MEVLEVEGRIIFKRIKKNTTEMYWLKSSMGMGEWRAVPCKELSLSIKCEELPNLIVNDDQQDATSLAHLFIPNQLYIFWAISSPIIRRMSLYLQLLILSTGIDAGWCHG